MKNIKKIGVGFLLIIVFFSCSSLQEKKVKKETEYLDQSIKFDKILRLNGNIKFFKNANRFFVYENSKIKVYDNLNLVYESKLNKAGRFEWGINGKKIYFVSYNSFIKDYHWLNSGKIKYIDISKKKI